MGFFSFPLRSSDQPKAIVKMRLPLKACLNQIRQVTSSFFAVYFTCLAQGFIHLMFVNRSWGAGGGGGGFFVFFSLVFFFFCGDSVVLLRKVIVNGSEFPFMIDG